MRAVTSSRLSLVLPSLPDASPEFLKNIQTCAEHLNEPLVLFRKLLSRADKTAVPAADRHALIFNVLTGEVQASPPVAALRALADDLQPGSDDYWLCADPVHLHPDLDHLLLFSGDSFLPTPAQAEQLVEELNQLFHDDAVEFIVGSHRHWYMRCQQTPDARFTALNKVVGKNILPFMPTGSEQKIWRRYLNEIQMQMTASEVNQQRAESGMAEVNSVWCWGGGQLPECKPGTFNRVYTEQAFSEGLARHMQLDVSTVPDLVESGMFANGEQLLEFAELADPDDPQSVTQFLHGLERDYLPSLYSDLRKDNLTELVIYFAGQRYSITSKTMHRWWRRTRPLSGLIS